MSDESQTVRRSTTTECAKQPMGMLKIAAGAALALSFAAGSAAALPVLPNAAGYGMDTPAGRGGKVYKVTNLNASGAGSLKACVDASGPRVCVFEVSGTIHADVDLIIRNPYITIAGQTAPSPGILWRGGALWVATSDVLVQHMRFRAGDAPNGPDPENRDALKIGGAKTAPLSKNIVIDHCSFSWAPDENVSLWDNWDQVTLTNNIISEGLRDSLNPLGQAGYGLILGPVKGHASIVGNLLAHNKARNPLSYTTNMVFVNNVVYNRANKDVDIGSMNGMVPQAAVVGNVFIRGADYGIGNEPVLVNTDGVVKVPSGTKVYVADNVAREASGDDAWSVVGVTEGTLPSSFKASTPPSWPAGLTRLSTDSNVVLSEVLRSAGARPVDRDPVDARVVKSVKDGTGQIINCVSGNGTSRCNRNAGGWPTLAKNTRVLQIPSNPNEVTASGYTKLEVWLHDMAARVEGRSGKPPIAPVLADR
jgi:hypothetical protein